MSTRTEVGAALLYAMPREAEGLLAKVEATPLEGVSGVPLYALPGGHVLAVGGVGKVNAALTAQLLLDRFAPRLLLNAGCAGALHPWPAGTVVVGSGCVQHDVDTTLAGDPAGFVSTVERVEFPCCRAEETLALLAGAGLPCRTGVVATGDWFGRDFRRAAWVRDRFSAALCDMEACAAAQVCLRGGTPFLCLKAVSDHLFSPAQDAEYRENFHRAMEALDAAVALVLQHMEG